MSETYSIKGVEIFSEGTWNGDTYTAKDLEGMVSAFEMHKEHVRPFLKLGHDKNQKLLQKDGMPAAGWVDRVYKSGTKLVADFVDLPKKIYELIQKRAYRKVSAEIYCGVSIGENKHPYMLGAVSLLGADMPGVGNLSDILAMYSQAGFKEIKTYAASEEFESRTYEFAANNESEETMGKSEAEIKLETQLEQAAKEKADLEGKTKQFAADVEKKEIELKELREFKVKAEEEKQKFILEKETSDRETFLNSLVQKKLCTPSMKQFAHALIGPEKKEYSFKVGAEEKSMNKQQAFEEMLKLFAAAKEVNFEESSSKGADDKADKNKLMEEKVQKYMAENKCTYSIAVKAVLSENKQGE